MFREDIDLCFGDVEERVRAEAEVGNSFSSILFFFFFFCSSQLRKLNSPCQHISWMGEQRTTEIYLGMFKWGVRGVTKAYKNDLPLHKIHLMTSFAQLRIYPIKIYFLRVKQQSMHLVVDSFECQNILSHNDISFLAFRKIQSI